MAGRGKGPHMKWMDYGHPHIHPGSPETPGENDHPNEPAGFTQICEHNLTVKPGNVGSNAQNGILGYWWRSAGSVQSWTQEELMYLNTNGSGAFSDPNYISCLFPNGFVAGESPTYWIGWADAQLGGGGSSPTCDELYIDFMLRVRGNASSPTANDGTTFENQAVGTKLFYVPYMNTTRQNHSIMDLKGNGTMNPQTTIEMVYFASQVNAVTGEDPGGGAIEFHQNIDATKYIDIGNWHKIEFYWKQNTLDVPPISDGIFKIWIDGILVSHHTNMRYCSTLNPRGAYQFRAASVYGGTGGTKTRDDYVDFDHVYISGHII